MLKSTKSKQPNQDRAKILAALIAYRSEELMESTIAACAIVAHADGTVDPKERQSMLTALRDNPLLSLVGRDLVIRSFQDHERRFAVDPQSAKAEALRQVASMAPYPRHARVVLNVCLLVTSADERVRTEELSALRDIRAALNLKSERGGSPLRPSRIPAVAQAEPASGTAQP